MCLDPIICAKLYNPQRKELRNRKEIHTERLEESNNQRKQLNEENRKKETHCQVLPLEVYQMMHFLVILNCCTDIHCIEIIHGLICTLPSTFEKVNSKRVSHQLIEFALRGKRFHSFPSLIFQISVFPK